MPTIDRTVCESPGSSCCGRDVPVAVVLNEAVGTGQALLDRRLRPLRQRCARPGPVCAECLTVRCPTDILDVNARSGVLIRTCSVHIYHRDVITEEDVASTAEFVDDPTGEIGWVVSSDGERLGRPSCSLVHRRRAPAVRAGVRQAGVQHHDNFGTWSYDMGIYDQGSGWCRAGQSFMTVRGMEFWGHHLNLVVLAFVPFYWLGAGPSFLYVAQAVGWRPARSPST
jgi:hypothetical protein